MWEKFLDKLIDGRTLDNRWLEILFELIYLSELEIIYVFVKKFIIIK